MAVENVIPRADIVKHADRLGAEIKNIALSDDLPDDVIVAFNRLLLEHKVIFFRDQGHLDDAQQQRFVLRLGSLVPNPTMADTMGGLTIRQELPGRACNHLNQMNDERIPAAISVLRLAAVPPFGGDVAWSSRAAAYLDLPDPLRMLADNLWAVSYVASDLTTTERAAETNKRPWCGVSTGTIYETTHPIVRVHPETGERLLSLGRSVNNFVGLQRYPSQRLFERLQSYLIAPRNTLCWNWRSGDVVIWDNRATEPYPANNTGSPHWAMDQLAIDARVRHVKRPKSRAAEAA
ncbi:TauD/TfdA family dioxygenase [Bradyrhizobium huanghuaihaiense]|uniref:TauD/TfdA dioxygenase family protein n=1 Tax=Bradyrhizobium huanghuaihaiense TaxID=990078 RepID=UPI0021AB0A9F|nr:TauD/TfdA family dioxygenase [Bradyrhizobium sp. CB3035]UWU75920.1 TauD/TfdA family dioxygenase [Bradyrhizobium sp. CB3035]UWU75934.1 TauD/TfdA family dioxygenase [Bradyrhizobium sp. CB3035]